MHLEMRIRQRIRVGSGRKAEVRWYVFHLALSGQFAGSCISRKRALGPRTLRGGRRHGLNGVALGSRSAGVQACRRAGAQVPGRLAGRYGTAHTSHKRDEPCRALAYSTCTYHLCVSTLIQPSPKPSPKPSLKRPNPQLTLSSSSRRPAAGHGASSNPTSRVELGSFAAASRSEERGDATCWGTLLNRDLEL